MPGLKVRNIVDGWWNYLNKNDSTKSVVKERAKTCAKCPDIKKGGDILRVLIKDKLKEIEGFTCGRCNCPLSAKIRTQEKSCEEWKK